MGIVFSDMVVESVIRDTFAAIRQNPARLDNLFENFNASWMQDVMGDKAINMVKTWIAENRIEIVQGFNQRPAQLPCISINLATAQEMKDLATLSDFAEEVDEVLVSGDSATYSSFMPDSYDATTGILMIPDSADLSNVSTSMLFVDVSGSQFAIVGGIDDAVGNKMLNIGVGQSVNIAGECAIVSNLDISRTVVNSIPINENLQIGIHTEGALLTKLLYYIVIYGFQVRRDTFIRRGIELTSFSSSDFTREPQFLPENSFSRFITLNGITRLYYTAKAVELAADTNLGVLVQKDTWPLDNEISFTVKNTPT